MVGFQSIEQLRNQALENRKKYFLSSIFSKIYTDREGKVIAKSHAPPLDQELDDEWVKNESIEYLGLWRHHIVGGFIEPARQIAQDRFSLEERHFASIVSASPFVSQGHEHIFAMGFERLFQGDYISALHLLVPQLEESLRNLLRNAGVDSSKIYPDSTQEDTSLSGLLERLRPDLERVLGPKRILEIEMLLSRRPGPALRHDLAHGKLSTAAFHSADAIFACWLIFHLCCFHLSKSWKELVFPHC